MRIIMPADNEHMPLVNLAVLSNNSELHKSTTS